MLNYTIFYLEDQSLAEFRAFKIWIEWLKIAVEWL